MKLSAVLAMSVGLLPLTAGAQTTTTYTYDDLGRVIAVNNSATNNTAFYQYDVANNRTIIQGGTGTNAPPICQTSPYNTNQASSITLTPAMVGCVDVNGNPMTFSAVSGTGSSLSGGSIVISGLSTTQQFIRNYNFTASDGQGGTRTGTFQIYSEGNCGGC